MLSLNKRSSAGGPSSAVNWWNSLSQHSYHLVETCEYGAIHDEMLRDRIVMGSADSSLSQRLQMIEDLTLKKAKTLVRQREAVHK